MSMRAAEIPLLLFIIFCFLPLFVQSQCRRAPVVFAFGDSNTDTGAYFSGLGMLFGTPNGRTYFNRPSGRLSDGRLAIDFLCESLNSSYLTPYLEPLGPDFRNGVNFAFAGAATSPRFKPFSLDVQVLQFTHFRARSPELILKGHNELVNEEDFKDALYLIDIGQNDLAGSFEHLSYEEVIAKIPSIIVEIDYAIQGIYQQGGRNFWVHNTGPLGCLPRILSITEKKASDFDEHGCLWPLNDASKEFNKQLHALCEELRSELEDSTLVYVDMYSIKYDLFANAATYGFENPLMACCGHGGAPYNYNKNITCGVSGHNVCDEGSKYINWDGVHYTEAANAIVASNILSTNYSTPQIKFNFFCNK
ncbi:zinc finger protein, putative [Ricinus communis]|uniref:Zinc finger protein, putative n=1 Tax=Ricinus communis TaxID=3988 RepID=B9RN86_RICCO|nr:zinc finger protein, putative [Ricinus communis]|eukprot:XP_002515225.1 GDSL esterase/lipase At1g09390 [Ricinus communis]